MFFLPKGKYMDYDLAEYIFWYCENKLNRPINHYQMQYILIYSCAEYLNRFNKYLMYEDYALECWNYGFLFRDLFFNGNYIRNYNGYNEVIGINYPNEDTYIQLNAKDKLFLGGMCYKLIGKSIRDFQTEMQNMKSYKDNFLPLSRDEQGIAIAQLVTIDEVAKDLKAITK